uniref:Uncharacterized protein n=1 Tax=Trypanosoma congolense (strain IL3000) TaxID=1068625 RepID=G0URD2_TRYCI|nr:conserved hypothetical protein [Trypanosoma congolense IL3000]
MEAEGRCSSSSPCDTVITAAEELEAHVKDCYSLMPGIDLPAAVNSIRATSPSGRSAVATVPWYGDATEAVLAAGPTGLARYEVEVCLNFPEGFTCEGQTYESLFQLLRARGCRAVLCA